VPDDCEPECHFAEGQFNFLIGVISAHDPFMLADQDNVIDQLLSNPALEADVCLLCGSISPGRVCH
jgi:hypothetical protein